MDKESRQIAIFFTFCVGAAIGFYGAKFWLVDILRLLNTWLGLG